MRQHSWQTPPGPPRWALLLAAILGLVILAGCSETVSVHVYDVSQEETVNGVTVGVSRVFFRPGYEETRPRFGYRKETDKVLLEGYVCNHTDGEVRLYNFQGEDVSTRQPLSVFSWETGEEGRATSLFIGGSRYFDDLAGATYFEVPANGGRQFTVTQDHRELPKAGDGVLELQRVQPASDGETWGYKIVFRLENRHTTQVQPGKEAEAFPVFDAGYSEPPCGRP